MTCITWPVALPTPEAPFSGEIGLPILSSSPTELGALESDRVHTLPSVSGSCTLFVDSTGLQDFLTFYRTTLNDGIRPFNAEWIYWLGYNGYHAKLLNFNVVPKGGLFTISLGLLFEPVVFAEPSATYFLDVPVDAEFDTPEENGASCVGYATFSGQVGLVPILQNGGSYGGSHNSSTSSVTHSPPWDGSSEHVIFGHTEVSSTMPAIIQPSLFSSTTYTHSHSASIVPLPIASGNTSSGFGDNNIVHPTSLLGVAPIHRAYVDNGCAEFEFVGNLGIRPGGVDAYIDLTVQILGEYGNILYEKVFPQHSGSLGTWVAISDAGNVPPGGRYVRYILFFNRNNYLGTSTYAFVNNMRMAWNLPLTGP